MKRYLARCVVYRERRYALSLVEIDGREVRITPFERETPGTVYVDGTLVIDDAKDDAPVDVKVLKNL